MSVQTLSTGALGASGTTSSRSAADGADIKRSAIRPFVTTGIALVGAGVIAVTPIAPAPPDLRTADIRVASPAVQLTAAPNPFEFYPQVVVEALANAGSLLEQYFTVVPEFATALLTDPIGVLGGTLFVLVNPFLYIAAVPIASSPVLNGLGAADAALTDVVNAAAALDLVDLVNAIVDIPARIIDGVLNGGYPFLNSSDVGLLTPYSPYDGSGPLGFPIFLAQSILSFAGSLAITSGPVDEPPNPQAATLTVSTGPARDSVSMPADAGLAEAGPETIADEPQGRDIATDVADELAQTTFEAPVPAKQELDTVTDAVGGLAGATPEAPAPATDEPANDADGLSEATTDEPAPAGQGLDASATEQRTGTNDLTDNDKAQQAQKPTTHQTTRKMPERAAVDKAGTDINKVSKNIKKASRGGKDDANNDTNHDTNNGDGGEGGAR